MEFEASRAAQLWKAHWPLIFSAMMGLSFGALPTASLGLFMVPLKAEPESVWWRSGAIFLHRPRRFTL